MLAILSAPGSRGDVNPIISIGRELSRRGHDVVVSMAEPYCHLAESAGLESNTAVSRPSFEKIISDPSIWKPFGGVQRVLQGVTQEFFDNHIELIRRRHRPGDTVLISHPLDFASRVFRDLHQVPLIGLHLAPVLLRTKSAPPRLLPWSAERLAMRYAFDLCYWLGDTLVLDRILASHINNARTEASLPRVKRILNSYWLSPDCVAGMYPQWFAPATSDYVPQLLHAGFPLDDLDDLHQGTAVADRGNPISPSDLSPRTIAFTGGSANHHTRRFFERAIRTCVELGVPGLLLSPTSDCIPDHLPDQVRWSTYVPLDQLLPRCGLIVHHGGIGTTSQALRAGTPQIVRPMAFDQFDNATRIERHRCGVWLRGDRHLSATVRELLEPSPHNSGCQECSERLSSQAPAANVIADEAEKLHDRFSNSAPDR